MESSDWVPTDRDSQVGPAHEVAVEALLRVRGRAHYQTNP